MSWRDVTDMMAHELPAFIRPGVKVYINGPLRAIVGFEIGRWHMSISHPKRNPRWAELRDARYALVPDHCYMAQILPPPDQYVNLHPHTFHLWQIFPTDLPETL